MLLGSVEESGDQHAHLTIWTFSHSCCFCHVGQSKQSLTKCNVFPISQMSCIVTYSSESQSSPVQLITLKATYLPNILLNEGESATDLEWYSI